MTIHRTSPPPRTGSGSSPRVCDSMAICDLRPLGLRGGSLRLSPQVHSSTATLSRSHLNPPPPYSGSRSTGNAPSGDQVLDSQGFSDALRRSRAGGLLLHFFPHNEEIGGVEVHTQPPAPQPFQTSETPTYMFPFANPRRNGCVSLWVIVTILPVPSPSLWSLNCPLNLHSSCQGGGEVSKKEKGSQFSSI